ncbi:hypothetical protein V6N12_052156 [Hibiscus sabdariffa]|uniref:Uncharacterized protein n=1 Tax=Hibiscus sabdariffa TaxID=183260 RepID=A0ABR2GHE6_9ROSI
MKKRLKRCSTKRARCVVGKVTSKADFMGLFSEHIISTFDGECTSGGLGPIACIRTENRRWWNNTFDMIKRLTK